MMILMSLKEPPDASHCDMCPRPSAVITCERAGLLRLRRSSKGRYPDKSWYAMTPADQMSLAG